MEGSYVLFKFNRNGNRLVVAVLEIKLTRIWRNHVDDIYSTNFASFKLGNNLL